MSQCDPVILGVSLGDFEGPLAEMASQRMAAVSLEGVIEKVMDTAPAILTAHVDGSRICTFGYIFHCNPRQWVRYPSPCEMLLGFTV